MEVLVFLVPLALTLGAIGLMGFSGRSRTASTTTSRGRLAGDCRWQIAIGPASGKELDRMMRVPV